MKDWIVKTLILLMLVIFIFPLISSALGDDNIEELEWPRKIETEKATIVIYQPQVEVFADNKLEARAALSVTTVDHPEPVFGAAWFDCRVSTDLDSRTVLLEDLQVPTAKFPDAKEENIEKLKDIIEEEIPKWEIEMSLDRLLAGLDMANTHDPLASQFNNEPPEIIYRTTPAALIFIDGDPILEDIEGEDYKYVVNTPFFIVQDKNNGSVYLKGGELWYQASDVLGPYEHIEKAPKKVRKIAEQAVEEVPDVDQDEDAEEQEPVVAEIIVRTTPAELIESNGEADFASVEGTSLLYLVNSENDILMDINTQQYYILISGRWYTSKSLANGPWTFVEPDQVPEDFSVIPAESDMGNVRASVAGTDEAKEALVENSVPQTATIDRESATVEVDYDGRAKFEKIEGTDIEYAINTDKSVLKIDNKYYCVDNGVWFISNKPTGPWEVCVVVPESVQDIPPESPVYNVKYVTVYDYTPEVVYVGYTPGYVNSYVYHGCVYYGTGWYYRPWYATYYYPRPVTWGFGVRWNPYTGWGFTFGVSVGGPYGWYSFGWHRPYHGWWGPAGYRHGYYRGYRHGYARGYARGYYHGSRSGYRAGHYSGQRNAAANNVYRNRNNGVSSTGGRQYNPRTGQQVASTRPANTQNRAAGRAGGANNVYTDRNGNVYRQQGDNWQKRDGGQWKDQPRTNDRSATQPQSRDRSNQQVQQQPRTNQQQQPRTNPNTNRQQQNRSMDNLNRDANSRNRGTQRSQQYNNNRQNYQYQRPSGGSVNRSGGARTGGRRR